MTRQWTVIPGAYRGAPAINGFQVWRLRDEVLRALCRGAARCTVTVRSPAQIRGALWL